MSDKSGELPERVDVAVVGAGTAGAATAAFAAQAGLRVLMIDRGPLARAGAQWINAVPASHFDLARLARPGGAECVGVDVPYHMLAGGAHVTVANHGMLEVDMARLVARLQSAAREAGATLEGGVRATGVEGNLLRTERGGVRADVIVDASGLAGAPLGRSDEPASRSSLCAAAQDVRSVRDANAAEAFFAEHGVPLGEVLSFAGTAGGFSVLNLRLHEGKVSMLAGAMPADGHPSGRALIDRFASQHPWIGPAVRSGARAIPLGRPLDVPVDGAVVRIGDAGRQVFSAHGSGVGIGLVAARMLVDAIVRGAGVSDYVRTFQRTHGGTLAAYDVFRRFSQTLAPTELEELIQSGLLDADMMRPALAQQMPQFGPRALLPKARAALAHRPLVARIGRTATRMQTLALLYGLYPGPSSRRLAAWRTAAARVAGDTPA